MIETPRLILRPWRQSDLPEFIRVTNTPAVMRYLGGVAAPEAMQSLYARMIASQAEHGFCFWIAQRQADEALLGFCGFKICTAGPAAGEIEIGWRLREDAWGQGYAHEAATACLDWAWCNLSCAQVVAITLPANTKSRALMQRLGLSHRPGLDFDHPNYPPGDPTRPHVTYMIARPS